mgnify:CR=1 FL=1
MLRFWKSILVTVFLPLAGLYHLTKLLTGRKKAIDFFYPKIVAVSAKILSLNIPTLQENENFSVFQNNFQRVLSRMPFEKIEVTVADANKFQIKVTLCQFTEVFHLLRMDELSKAFCDGDVVFCEKYQPALNFERKHAIQNGDAYCDHTFTRKK